MSHLFEPLTIGSVTLRNRIGLSPMQTYSSSDGMMNDWHLVQLGSYALGGAGLVMAEATAVEPEGRVSLSDTAIWSNDFIPSIRRVADFVNGCGAVFGLQLGHAGRRAAVSPPWEGNASLADGGWKGIGPSSIPFRSSATSNLPPPKAMTIPEIQATQQSFVRAAGRALEAGVRWLELHAAHGYLLHSFKSPVSNQRDDKYGGSFENRTRFTVDTVRAIREVWPVDLPLSVRLSATEYMHEGWSLDDTVRLSHLLKEEGADVIVCSSGAGKTTAEKPRLAAASYQVPYAERVRREAGVMTGAVGMIRDPFQADEILRNERADIVFIGRQLIREPRWPMRAAEALGHKLTLPKPLGFSI